MINSILVATDASPPSNRAVTFSADLASKYGAMLSIVHVVRDMQLPSELRKMAEVEKLAGERQDVLAFVGRKILDDAEARAVKKGAKKIKLILGKGDPANEILKQAKKSDCDLIVLGTRGLGKVQGMLLGSVSRKVTNLSGINCLVMR